MDHVKAVAQLTCALDWLNPYRQHYFTIINMFNNYANMNDIHEYFKNIVKNTVDYMVLNIYNACLPLFNTELKTSPEMINKFIEQYNQSIELRENAVNHINCNSIIGIRDIDEEHIHINNCMFYLLNTAKNTNMQCQQILEHMSNLKTKLIIHFENEELVLSKIDAYEHTKMQQIHYDVLDQFNKAYDAIIVSPISILEYIKNLLHEHINTCDIILKK